MFASNAVCPVLALAPVLAFVIDIHVRADLTVTNELGNWIAYYVEPALLHSPFQSQPASFVLWENFLRISGGQHISFAPSLTLWPHSHFLTWIIYAIYLAVFQHVLTDETHQSSLTMPGFWLVHVTILAFAWIAHSIPPNFEYHPLGNDWTLPACWAPIAYSIPVALLTSWNLRYGKRLKAAV